MQGELCLTRGADIIRVAEFDGARVEGSDPCSLNALMSHRLNKARGPFTVQDTLALIQSLRIGTLVTKESGRAGGVPQKLEAAALAKCNVVIVKRAAFDEHNLYRTLRN